MWSNVSVRLAGDAKKKLDALAGAIGVPASPLAGVLVEAFLAGGTVDDLATRLTAAGAAAWCKREG